MPCRAEHARIGRWTGGLTAAVLNLAHQDAARRLNPAQPFDLGTFIASTLGGIFLGEGYGIAADMLEPGTHSYHRDVCHSFAALGLVCYAGIAAQGVSTWGPVAKGVVTVAAAGYASHLVADACTPRGLPLLGR